MLDLRMNPIPPSESPLVSRIVIDLYCRGLSATIGQIVEEVWAAEGVVHDLMVLMKWASPECPPDKYAAVKECLKGMLRCKDGYSVHNVGWFWVRKEKQGGDTKYFLEKHPPYWFYIMGRDGVARWKDTTRK